MYSPSPIYTEPQGARAPGVTLVLDHGTQASRALLFDPRGRLLHVSKRCIGLIRRSPREVEQDPQAILDSLRGVLDEALAFAARARLEVKQAGLATQRSTVVAWDRYTGTALGPALSWQDTRTAPALERWSRHALMIQARTGLRLSPHYGASKLNWMLHHARAVRRAAAQGTLAMGPLAAFLLSHLIEGRPLVVDHGNAGRTLLWNIHRHGWDGALLELFEIDRHWLPRTLPIRHPYGRIQGTDIPLTAVHGDQGAAFHGYGGAQADTAVVNMGTGAFVLTQTGTHPIHHPPLLSGIVDSDGQQCRYCLEGTVNGAGSALAWAREAWGLEGLSGWSETEDPPLFLNRVGGLGSPWWRSGGEPELHAQPSADCRKDPAPCLAAVMESIVFMIYANLQRLDEAGLAPHRLVVGGGLSRDRELCQRIADLSGLPVLRMDQAEITGRGMAHLATGLGAGLEPAATQRFGPRADRGLRRRYLAFVDLIERHTG
jgi:glycerol kinase